MTDKLSPEAQQKKKCCEQSFLGSVVGLQKDDRKEVGSFRRGLGLFILFGVHLYMLSWNALWSLFQPRYRRVLKFQWRYFKDVMAKELRQEPPAAQ